MTLVGVLLLQTLTPVQMTEVKLGPPTPIVGGKVSDVKVGDLTATLFVPDGWKADGPARVCMHFHTAAWYIVSQYQSTGLKDPVVTFNFGQGSTVYGNPFKKEGSFAPWLAEVENQLHTKVDRLVVSSFSAGFGAVRELIRQPDFLDKLETVVLSDSMYGSFTGDPATRTVLPEHAACWKPLVERALAGKTTVVMTCSAIHPPTYAGTDEVSAALVKQMGGEMVEVTPDGSEQSLIRRYDKGKWHVWHYAGITPTAHMTQARHLKDVLLQVYPK
ncbi:MAG: hypothetical protein JST35_12450 [Armatimonadetes bacterium]|nr:hypothetical protein [Armatimonadota bacterium]